MSTPASPRDSPQAAALLAATDWSSTPLGPQEDWPLSLRSYVSMIMAMPWPAIIFWGAEQTQIYNDGYAVIMGPRHPRFFGATYRECWPDTYPTIYPWMRRVLEDGEVIKVDRAHIPLTRYGFDEEAYFTFTFTPLRDDEGRIAGILQPVFEVTASVLADRRATTLRALGEVAGATTPIDRLVEVLADNPGDLPFAALWLRDTPDAPLAFARGVRHDGLDAASWRRLEAGAAQTWQHKLAQVVDALAFAPVQAPSTGVQASSALLLPLDGDPSSPPRGVIAFGLSPRLHVDDRYREWLELVARQSAASLQRASLAAAAERQRRFLDELFQQAPAGIAVLRGPTHLYQLVNPIYLSMSHGRARIGAALLDCQPELATQPVRGILDQVYASGKTYVGHEVPILQRRPGGEPAEEHFYTFVYQPLRDPHGAVDSILVLAFDVTAHVHERQRAEALTRELRLEHERKDEFLAMLAHELRSPLAPIRSAAEALLRGRLNEARVYWASGIIGRQVSHMAALIDDLLDVSRVTRGLVNIERRPQDLKQVVAQAVEQVRPLIEARQHRLTVATSPATAWVEGDHERLVQVVANLLNNAAKYTREGGEIAVSMHSTPSCNGVEIEVRDNGIGLTAELQPRVFDLFVQGERSGDRALGGLGIGLALVRSLVELHGGAVDCESAGPGQGSTFRVRLPLQEPPPASSTEPAPFVATTSRRVLVIDDNEDGAQMMALLLESLGHEARAAYSAEAALALTSLWAPSLFLIDIGLPDLDGKELARRLRAMPATAQATLVAVTGYGQPADREAGLAAGFDEYLVKPVSADDLASLLAAAAPR